MKRRRWSLFDFINALIFFDEPIELVVGITARSSIPENRKRYGGGAGGRA